MKRILVALFVASMILPAFTASAKKRKPKDAHRNPGTIMKGGQETPRNLKTGPKRVGSNDDGDDAPVQKGTGPVALGEPVELRAAKANGSGHVFDLRALPYVPPTRRERPERQGPK